MVRKDMEQKQIHKKEAINDAMSCVAVVSGRHPGLGVVGHDRDENTNEY